MGSRSAYKWYVYLLVDPRCGKAFYVGKGVGERARQHEKDVKRGIEKNPAKSARIESILRDGLSVSIAKVAYFSCEKAARNYESSLIRNSKGLTNIARNKNKPIVVSLYATIGDILSDSISRKPCARTYSSAESDRLASGLT